jgi:hypothetical protein
MDMNLWGVHAAEANFVTVMQYLKQVAKAPVWLLMHHRTLKLWNIKNNLVRAGTFYLESTAHTAYRIGQSVSCLRIGQANGVRKFHR